MFELIDNLRPNVVIKAIGIGDGGCNAVAHMIHSNIEGVEFICANTDAQAIKGDCAKSFLQLGGSVTKGLGASANPEVGRQAALEDRERIVQALEGADMVFITAGMGGGTGTGAAPVVAQLAKEMGILTVAVVTQPFPFEGRRRMQVALKGIEELSKHCDSLITIPNEKLITVLGRDATMIQAFRASNEILLGTVKGIADLIVRPGLINVDFADIRTVMSEMGRAMMGSGSASGGDRAMAAAKAAIGSQLLEDINLADACGILVNITAGPDFTMREFDLVGRSIENVASENATVVLGTVLGHEMKDEVRVTVFATGLDHAKLAPGLERAKASADARDYLDIPAFLLRQPDDATKFAGSKARDGETDYLDIPTFLRRQADEVSPLAIESDSLRIVAHPDVSAKSLALFVEVLSALYAGVSDDALVISRATPIPSVPVRRRKPDDEGSQQVSARA